MKITKTKVVMAGLLFLSLLAGAMIAVHQLSPQRRFARYVIKARLYMSAGQTGAALREYEKALIVDPQNDIALCELGYTRLALEQPERAEAQFQQCLDLHPKYVRAWVGLIRARISAKKLDGVVSAAAQLLELQRDPATLVVYGDALVAVGSYDAALGAYREAVTAGPSEYEPLQQRVNLLLSVQRNHEARQVLLAYANRDDAKQREKALAALAEMALREDRPEQALAYLDRALAITRTSELLVRRAEVRCRLRQYAPALKDLELVFQGSAPAPQAYKVRAVCLFEQGDMEGALRDAQLALRNLPEDAPLALLLGHIHAKTGRVQQAQEEARRALKLQPDFFAAQNFLMTQLVEHKQYEQAISLGGILLERSQRSDVAMRWLVRAYLASNQEEEARSAFSRTRSVAESVSVPSTTGKVDANQDVRRLTQLRPEQRDTASIQYLLGQAYLSAKDLRQALIAFTRAAEIEPQRFETQLTLASIYATLGQPELAAERLESVVALAPDAIQPLLALAQLRMQQRKYALAATWFEKLLALPDSPPEAVTGLINARLAQQDLKGLAQLADQLRQDPTPQRQAVGWIIQATLQGRNNSIKDAVESLDRALALAPDLPLALHEKALYCLNAGQPAEALSLLDRIETLQPQAKQAAWLDYSGALLLAGKLDQARTAALENLLLAKSPESVVLVVAGALKAGASEEAQQSLQYLPEAGMERQALAELLKLPQAPAIFEDLMLADLFGRNGLISWSLLRLQDALKLAPGNPELLAINAAALIRVGRLDQAAETLAGIIQQHPRRPDTILMLADLRHAQGNDEQALALYQQVLDLAPNHARALATSGVLLRARGQYQEAAEHLLKALKQAPNDLATMNNYAWLLAVDLKTPQRALTYADDLCRSAPNNAHALDTAGWIFFLNNNDTEALRALSYSALLAPNSGDIAYHYGMTLWRSQRHVEALRELKRVKTLGSRLDLASAAERAIADIERKQKVLE